VGGDLADDSSSATIWWSSNADPDLADGSPGSGTIGEVYRYRVGDGAWSAWTATDVEGFTLPGAHDGDHVFVEVRSSDLVGNLSDVTSAEVTLSSPQECGIDECPDRDDLEEDSFAAMCDGSATQPDWCSTPAPWTHGPTNSPPRWRATPPRGSGRRACARPPRTSATARRCRRKTSRTRRRAAATWRR
jgi:hypothetical protein